MMFLKGIEGRVLELVEAGRLVRRLDQQFRRQMLAAWTRVITVEKERSCWILDVC